MADNITKKEHGGVKTVSSGRRIFDNSMDEFTIEAVDNNVSIKLNGFDGGEIAII